ncbi:hypothetical protein V5O48_019073, partial [Marasmius crinis-equi]
MSMREVYRFNRSRMYQMATDAFIAQWGYDLPFAAEPVEPIQLTVHLEDIPDIEERNAKRQRREQFRRRLFS